MANNETVNQIINYSVAMVDDATKGKNYPGKLKQMQYLIFAGMLSYLGPESIQRLHKVFKETDFTMTNLPFSEFFKDDKEAAAHFKEQETDFYEAFVPATRCTEIDTSMFMSFDSVQNLKVKHHIYVSNYYDMNQVDFLECFGHEINHSYNSIVKPIIVENGQIFSRTGMALSDLREQKKKGIGLEEVGTVLQNAEVVNEILSFGEYDIENPVVASALENLKYTDIQQIEGVGYEHLTPYFRPLYQDSSFKQSLNNARESGNLGLLEQHIDRKMGTGSYQEIIEETDRIVENPSPYQNQKILSFQKRYLRK